MEAIIPDDSAGNNSLVPGYLAVTGQTILASQHNPPLEDLSASMSRRYMRDGRAPMLGNVPMNGYRATGAADGQDPQDYVTMAQMEALLAAIHGVPTGTMTYLSGTAVPVSWVRANGQSLVRATYPDLWAWAQESGNLANTQADKTPGQYGPGNGTTTFTLPDLEASGGYFIRPMTAGRTVGSSQAEGLKAHSHTGTTDPNGGHNHTYQDARVTNSGGGVQTGTGRGLPDDNQRNTSAAPDHTHSFTTNQTGDAETRPKNIAYPVIIKA